MEPSVHPDIQKQVFSKVDPRVFFAAERTLLAWVRTGIAAIGLGFLVARFGYFLMMVNPHAPQSHQLSSWIGMGMVLLGTMMIAASAWQHSRFLKSLQTDDLPRFYLARLSLVLAGLLVVTGLALAWYLFATLDGSQRLPPQEMPHQLAPRL